MENIDLTRISTFALVKEIVETAEVLAQLVLAEMKMETALKMAADIPGAENLVIKAQAEFDQLVCHRREGVKLVVAMTQEYNSRPDRGKDLPLAPAILKMAEA